MTIGMTFSTGGTILSMEQNLRTIVTQATMVDAV